MTQSYADLSCSTFLGPRAKIVYEWFLKSLCLPGDIAECGVFTGETSRELVRYLDENSVGKTLHMFDTFEGLPDLFTAEERENATGDGLSRGNFFCPLPDVLRRMGPSRRFRAHKGLFSETFAGFVEDLCFIHADADLYQSTVEIIGLAERCLVPGGHIVFDDYRNSDFPGVTWAIDHHLSADRYIIRPLAESIQCCVTKR